MFVKWKKTWEWKCVMLLFYLKKFPKSLMK